MQKKMVEIDIKDIHIGPLLYQRVTENNIEISRICNFLKCSEEEIKQMYEAKSLDTEVMLRWSKLLEYDFFRIYSQHLILYAPQGRTDHNEVSSIKNTKLPQFRKNIYTKEVIDFILEQINNGNKTKKQIVEEYKIPKTTLYKWMIKYMKTVELNV